MSLILNETEIFNLTPLYLNTYPSIVYNMNIPKGVYFYSFCKHPLEYNPTGFLNGKRIDNNRLIINFPKQHSDTILKINIYANTLNMLHVCDKLNNKVRIEQ